MCMRDGWDAGWTRLGCSTGWHTQKLGLWVGLLGEEKEKKKKGKAKDREKENLITEYRLLEVGRGG